MNWCESSWTCRLHALWPCCQGHQACKCNCNCKCTTCVFFTCFTNICTTLGLSFNPPPPTHRPKAVEVMVWGPVFTGCCIEHFLAAFQTTAYQVLFINHPPPPCSVGGRGSILESLCLYCLCVQSCPLNKFPELFNHFFFFLPNLVWWCIVMRRCMMWKNWFTIFNVKVTAKAYIIKIWLYRLNCWSVCNQTWFGRTPS